MEEDIANMPMEEGVLGLQKRLEKYARPLDTHERLWLDITKGKDGWDESKQFREGRNEPFVVRQKREDVK